MLKYILVGCGGWGGYWCREVLPRLAAIGKADPAAIVDINPEALCIAGSLLKVPADRQFTDAPAAFGSIAADFAIIVVPPAFHESIVDLALAHDLHILSEKPISDSMAACCRIYRKVCSARRKMAVTMSHRFDRDKQSLEAAVLSGDYGRLNYVVHRFTHNCREFASWGRFRHEIADPLLVEGTVHHFDMLRAISQSDADVVYAQSWNPSWGQYAGDSTAMIVIRMLNGVRCLYEGAKANASTLNGWGSDYLRAECETGTLELDKRRLRVLRGGPWDEPVSEELPLLEREPWLNPWIAEMFCDWLAGGPAPPTHIDDNLQCCALLFAAIESAHTGAPVDVQRFLAMSLNAHG